MNKEENGEIKKMEYGKNTLIKKKMKKKLKKRNIEKNPPLAVSGLWFRLKVSTSVSSFSSEDEKTYHIIYSRYIYYTLDIYILYSRNNVIL